MSKKKKDSTDSISRRDLLKGLATLPIFGAFAYGVYKKKKVDEYLAGNANSIVGLSYDAPPVKSYSIGPKSSVIRLGIIGYGSRGEHLVRSTGHAHPEVLAGWKKNAIENSNDKRYEEYLQQDDMNVQITGVCDVFDVHAQRGIEAANNKERLTDVKKTPSLAKRYTTYKELIDSPEIDAIIIGTPDHLHAEIIVAAAKAGKHVYTEKAMTRTFNETFAVRKAVKESGIIFQLGHQGRQTESYMKAREVIKNDVIGKVSLIEVTTNRNNPNGAWVYDIHPAANPSTVDWKQFLGNAKEQEFSAEKFFRWRCWWDFGTGLSGDLFTHEFDAINQIMELGIPDSVMSTGGIYYFNDGREVPDVLQIACEYKQRELTLLYSGTLASNKNRGKTIMGHDGYMEISDKLNVYADHESTKYKEKIKDKTINTNTPIFSYIPGKKHSDAVSSATEKYFASRGLLYTYRNNKRVDTTFLHIKEWLDCIRNNVQPSCDIDQGFQEAITAHMGTLSYMSGKKVFWDAGKEKATVA